MNCIKDGKIVADQGIIVGCAGGMYEEHCRASSILQGDSIGDSYFNLSVYPASAPISLAITRDGTAARLMETGAVIKPAFCGPCFGAGDTPANNGFHPPRHQELPQQGGFQARGWTGGFVALMDARSIAATARKQGSADRSNGQ